MRRSRSSYNKININKKLNESSHRKNESLIDNNNLEITNFSPTNKQINEFHITTRNYKVNPNEYKTKLSSQLKRKRMFNELWNKNINGKDNLGLFDTIKVQSKRKKNIYNNIIGNVRDIIGKNKVSSAGTLCDLKIKNKDKNLPFYRLNSSINLNILVKNNVRNFSTKRKNNININSDMNTITKCNSQDIQIGLISPINSNHISVITNVKDTKEKNNDEAEKNNNEIVSEEVNKFLEETKQIKNNYENKSDALKLRSEYLIKFSKLSETFQKLVQYSECFRIDYRGLFNSSIKTISKYFNKYNDFLLNKIKIGDNISINLLTSIMIYLYEFCLYGSKLQKIFCDELNYLKKENLNLKTKINSQENELNQKNKEINQVNELIIKYDLNTKVKNGRKIESYLEETKAKFNNQESSYILTIYQLEEEIRHLTKLLKQNQKELNKKDDMKDKFKQLRNEVGDELVGQKKTIEERNIQCQFLSQRISELNSKISELESEITILKQNGEKEKQRNIYYNAQIKNLNNIINENNEIIESLKSEIDNLKNTNKKEEEEKDNNICKIVMLPPQNI